MSRYMAMLFSMLAVMLVVVMGLLKEGTSLLSILITGAITLLVYFGLGMVFANVGRDLFREAMTDSRLRREERSNEQEMPLSNEENKEQ